MSERTEPLKPGTIQFVTDGPPAHKSGRFVELEDHTGASIGTGRWEDRGNGLWALIVEPAGTAAVEAVMELHRPVEVEPSETICAECSTLRGQGETARYFPFTEYPCPTAQALTAALEVEG